MRSRASIRQYGRRHGSAHIRHRHCCRVAPAAFAQDAFPSRPVTIVNAFPPGGANDIVTRPDRERAGSRCSSSRSWSRPRPAPAGAVGAQVAASAKPDGYTLLSHNNGISGYAEVDKLFGRQPKTTRADFIPLARLFADPVLLLVNDQQPYKTLKEFIDDAKKSPEAIVYSSGGLYGATHLPVALLEKATGISEACAICRPMAAARRSRPCSATMRRSRTQTVSATLQHIKAGKLRALASFGAQRSKALPDVPTMKELGYDVEYYLWVGLFAPKGTPGRVVSTLERRDRQGGASPSSSTAAIANIGLEPTYLNAADFAKFWDDGRQALRRGRAARSASRVNGCRPRRMTLRADHVAGRRSSSPSASLVFALSRRSAVRRAVDAGRRHAAEAHRRPDDPVRRRR